MFKGRTATFAGLVNRISSLVAGTFSTIIVVALFGIGKVNSEDWVALIFIFIAIYFMSKAEKKRVCELVTNKELGGSGSECK
jgi:hypothetical protein